MYNYPQQNQQNFQQNVPVGGHISANLNNINQNYLPRTTSGLPEAVASPLADTILNAQSPSHLHPVQVPPELLSGYKNLPQPPAMFSQNNNFSSMNANATQNIYNSRPGSAPGSVLSYNAAAPSAAHFLASQPNSQNGVASNFQPQKTATNVTFATSATNPTSVTKEQTNATSLKSGKSEKTEKSIFRTENEVTQDEINELKKEVEEMKKAIREDKISKNKTEMENAHLQYFFFENKKLKIEKMEQKFQKTTFKLMFFHFFLIPFQFFFFLNLFFCEAANRNGEI